MMRFADDSFKGSFMSTVGIDFVRDKFSILCGTPSLVGLFALLYVNLYYCSITDHGDIAFRSVEDEDDPNRRQARQDSNCTSVFREAWLGWPIIIVSRYESLVTNEFFASFPESAQWDTAGQERFRTITKTYYRGAHGYVLVYDITNQESFDHVKYWLGEIKKNGNEEVHKVIVGNKADLEDQRMVKYDEGKAFSDEKNIPFLETSAKDGLNVQDLFMRMTRGYLKLAVSQAPQ